MSITIKRIVNLLEAKGYKVSITNIHDTYWNVDGAVIKGNGVWVQILFFDDIRVKIDRPYDLGCFYYNNGRDAIKAIDKMIEKKGC